MSDMSPILINQLLQVCHKPCSSCKFATCKDVYGRFNRLSFLSKPTFWPKKRQLELEYESLQLASLHLCGFSGMLVGKVPEG